jgi:hypothetical protein
MPIIGILASSITKSANPSFFAYLATTTSYYGSCVNSDGIYTVGQVGNNTTSQVLVTRFNFDGTVNWQRTLDKASQSDIGYAIIADSSGNVYVFGQYYKDATDTVMSFMAKYNSSGTLQYQKSIDLATTRETITAAAITSAGDIYVAGGYNFASNFNNVSVMKLNTTPTVSWARSWLDSLGGDTVGFITGNRGIAVDSSDNSYSINNAIVTLFETTTNVCQIAKYNSSGTIQSGAEMDATSGTSRNIRGIASDGTNILVTGLDYREGATSHAETVYVAKLPGNSLTTTTWVKAINVSPLVNQRAITCSSTGDVYVTTTDNVSSDYRILIFKYNSSGTLQWQRRIDLTTPGSNQQAGWTLSIDESRQRLIIGGQIVDNVFTAFVPTDGSGTGTYTVGSYTLTYDTPSYTSSDLTTFANFTAVTPTSTTRTATVSDSNMTGATSSFTANKVTF